MAQDLPPGFEIETAPQPSPFGYERGRTLQESSYLRPGPQAALPEGFEIEKQPQEEAPGPITAAVRAAAEGIPIIGALPQRLNAATESLFTGVPYQEALARQKRMSAAGEAAYPITTTATGLAGGLGAGGALLRTAPTLGARLLGFGGTTLPGQMLRMGASGAGIGAIDTALRGGEPERGALVGGALGAGAGAAGQLIGTFAQRLAAQRAARMAGTGAFRPATEEAAATAATPPEPPPSPIGAGPGPLPGPAPIAVRPPPPGVNFIDERGRVTPEFLDHSIDRQYEALDRAATAIKPNVITEGMKDVRNTLRLQNFRPEYQPEVFRILDGLEAKAERGAVQFADVVAAQKALNAMRGPMQTTNQAAAGFASHGLTDFLESLHPQRDVTGGNVAHNFAMLQNVKADYTVKKPLDRLLMARDLAQSGALLNPANNLRTQVRAVLREVDRGKLRLPDETVGILRQLVRQFTNPVALAAKFSPKHHLSLMGEIGAGFAGMPGSGLAAAGIGKVAEMADVARTSRLFDQAVQSLMRNAPSVQRFQSLMPAIPESRTLSTLGRLRPTGLAAAGTSEEP